MVASPEWFCAVVVSEQGECNAILTKSIYGASGTLFPVSWVSALEIHTAFRKAGSS